MMYKRLRRGEIEHRLYVGITQQGKSALAKWDAYRATRQHGRLVFVFTPNRDEAWPCAFQTADPFAFCDLVEHEKNHGAICIIDEAMTDFFKAGRENDKERRVSMATKGRHRLQEFWIIGTHYMDCPIAVRESCTYLTTCQQGRGSAKAMAEERNDTALLDAVDLTKGNYLIKPNNNEPAELSPWDFKATLRCNPSFARLRGL